MRRAVLGAKILGVLLSLSAAVPLALYANHQRASAGPLSLPGAQVLRPVKPGQGAIGLAGQGNMPKAYQPSRPPKPGTPFKLEPRDAVVVPAPTAIVPKAQKPVPSIRRRGGTRHPWFWDQIPTATAARAQRDLLTTMAVVQRRQATNGAMTTAAEARALRQTYAQEIATAAVRHGVSELVVLAVIVVESAGKPKARSHKGAQGLMQLMPATGRRFGVGDPYDPQSNILAGTAYLDWLLRRFDEDLVLALAGYNAGEGAVDKHAGVPPFRETRDYVVRVMDAFVSAQSLCRNAPVGPRDRCDWIQ